MILSARIRFPEAGVWQIWATGNSKANELSNKGGQGAHIDLSISANRSSFGWEKLTDTKNYFDSEQFPGADPKSKASTSWVPKRGNPEETSVNSNFPKPSDTLSTSDSKTRFDAALSGLSDNDFISNTTANEQNNVITEIETNKQQSFLEKRETLLSAGATELVEMRTQNSQVFQIPDIDKKILLTSSGLVHYKDNNSSYQMIDNTIIDNNWKNQYSYSNKANSFSVYFPSERSDDSDISFTSKSGSEIKIGKEVKYTIEGNDKNKTTYGRKNINPGEKNKNSIYYDEPRVGISESYIVKSWGLKHNYIIQRPIPELLENKETLEFTEMMTLPENSIITLDGIVQSAGFTTNKDIILLDKDNGLIAKLPAPHAFEGTPDTYSPRDNNKIPLSFEVVFLENNQIQISVLVPIEWLDQTERIYPLTIDPSIDTRDSSSENNDDGYQDTDTSVDCSEEFNIVGKGYYNPFFEYATYMMFRDIGIPKGYPIDDVTLYVSSAENWSATGILTDLKFQLTDNATQPSESPLIKQRDYGNFQTDYSADGTWSMDEIVSIPLEKESLQEIINLDDPYDWEFGNYIGLIWEPREGCVAENRYIRSNDSSEQAPYLLITFTDSVAPILTIDDSPSSTIHSSNVNFSWHSDDECQGSIHYSYYLERTAPTPWASEYVYPNTYNNEQVNASYSGLLEGDYELYIYSADDEWNIASSCIFFSVVPYTISGQCYYRNRDWQVGHIHEDNPGSYYDAINCVVYLRSGPSGPVIGTGTTDGNGSFTISDVLDEGEGATAWIASSMKYYTGSNSVKIIVDPVVDANLIPTNEIENSYSYLLGDPIYMGIAETSRDIGNFEIYPRSDGDFLNVQAWWIKDDLDKGFQYILEQQDGDYAGESNWGWPLGYDGRLNAIWSPTTEPPMNENGVRNYLAYYDLPITKNIYIRPGYAQSKKIALHEMGHQVMDLVYGGTWGQERWPEAWADLWPHLVTNLSNLTSSLALLNEKIEVLDGNEWAAFFYRPTGEPRMSEYIIERALWDLYDDSSSADGLDQYTGNQANYNLGIGRIWYAFTSHPVTSFHDYWHEFLNPSVPNSYYPALDQNDTICAARALYQNQIYDYEYLLFLDPSELRLFLTVNKRGNGTVVANYDGYDYQNPTNLNCELNSGWIAGYSRPRMVFLWMG